ERDGLHPEGLRRGAAHPPVPADAEHGHAEERLRLPLLVPPPARLPHAGESIAPVIPEGAPRAEGELRSYPGPREAGSDSLHEVPDSLAIGLKADGSASGMTGVGWIDAHVAVDPQAPGAGRAEPGRRGDRHVPADACAAWRSRGVLRRAG